SRVGAASAPEPSSALRLAPAARETRRRCCAPTRTPCEQAMPSLNAYLYFIDRYYVIRSSGNLRRARRRRPPTLTLVVCLLTRNTVPPSTGGGHWWNWRNRRSSP